MGQNQLNLAIQSFQNAIRIDENDSKSWECLGDAYLLQGSYGASLNAFNKLVQLKPDDIYSAFQVSKNKQLLELYTEASEAYREIIKTNSKYIPACLGLAECQFFMAKDYFRQSLFGLAKQLASEALVFLNLRVFPCKSNYVSLYKLAGDLTVLLASLGSNHLPIELPCQLYGLPKRDTTFSMLDLLTSANCCYGRATAIKPEIPTLWHDLGLSYYLSSQCHTESSIAKRVSEKSLACFRKALELNPINPTYWMSMGVVSATTKLENGFAFAQHCFIKTLQLDPKNVTAWSNLGVLYLMNENLALANEAFSRGQSVDPSNEIPWIGQALIAETMGHEQTLELFRHSSILKPNTEGVLGYAHWLISQLVQKSETSVKNINPELDYKTRWITQAVDGLVKLTATEKTKAEAFHYLALALERQKLFKPAAYAARLSYKLLKEGQPSIQNLEASKVNLARILRLAGSKEESLSLLTEIKNPDTSIYCETALAFLETGSPEKAFQAYEMALKVCEEKSHHLQADILTAMAFVVRKIPGFEDQAKTYLFKGVNCQSQSIPGLLALCALGFLNSDSILINAALSELEQYKYNLNYWPKIAHLLAINKAIQGDTESAIRQLCKAIYWQPASSELWSHLAKFLLLAGGNRSTKATQCAKNAWIHSPKNYNDLDQTFTMVSSFLAAGDIKSSRSLALRAVHYQPDNAKSWCCLLATSMANPSKHKSIEIITRCVEKLSDSWFKLPTANLFLKDWLDATLLYNRLSNNSSKTIANVSMEIDTNSIGKNTYVAKHLERALAEKDVASYLKNILNEDETVVSQSVVWTTLIKTQLNDAQYKEAEENICQWLQILENGEMPTEEKIIPLLYLSLLAKEAMHVKNDQLEHWINLGKEASTQATKLMKDCHVAHFLLALFQLNSVGKEASKLAKKSLEKSILSSKESKETSLNFEIATKKLLSHIMEINLSSQNK